MVQPCGHAVRCVSFRKAPSPRVAKHNHRDVWIIDHAGQPFLNNEELSFQVVEDNIVEVDIPELLQSESVDIWFEWPDASMVSVLYDKTAEKGETCEDMNKAVLPPQDEAPNPPEESCGCSASPDTSSPVFPLLFIVFFIVFRAVPKTGSNF